MKYAGLYLRVGSEAPALSTMASRTSKGLTLFTPTCRPRADSREVEQTAKKVEVDLATAFGMSACLRAIPRSVCKAV